MMGMTMPTQSSLSDLTTLLQLLQAASDPKASKAAIEKISEARKQYDDAIAESVARAAGAAGVEAKALAAADKAAAAEAKLDKKMAALEVRAIEVNDAAAATSQDRLDFEVYKTEIGAIAKANTALKMEQEAYIKKALADVAGQRKAVEAQAEALDAATATTEAVRAEYEAKLAKFKALTE